MRRQFRYLRRGDVIRSGDELYVELPTKRGLLRHQWAPAPAWMIGVGIGVEIDRSARRLKVVIPAS